jgi:hypothetical protein
MSCFASSFLLLSSCLLIIFLVCVFVVLLLVAGISDEWFTLTDDAVLAALGQIGFMPTLVLAARLCPPGIEVGVVLTVVVVRFMCDV